MSTRKEKVAYFYDSECASPGMWAMLLVGGEDEAHIPGASQHLHHPAPSRQASTRAFTTGQIIP